MSKKSFVQVVEQLFAENTVQGEVLDYFNKNYKATPKKSRDTERADLVKAAILEVLREKQSMMDRNEIGQALSSMLDERYIKNEKGHIAFNSITTFANQLVQQGLVDRKEVRERKAKRVKYQTT